MEKPHAFTTLDGLRGIAAFAVAIFHFPAYHGRSLVPHGYLAVDFFFMLSGFVLTFAYQAKLDAGWSSAAFFKTRIARLYPLYLFGLLAGFSFVYLQALFASAAPQARSHVLYRLFLGLLLLPSVTISLFPLNMPSWSIFFELQANMIHAWFLRRRSSWFIVLFTLTGAAGLFFCIYYFRIFAVGGGGSAAGPFGLCRVIFGYTVGILLFRIWRRMQAPLRLPSSLIALILLALLAAPVTGVNFLIYDSAVVMLIFPVLVLCGASAVSAPWLVKPYRVLGHASYAMYMIAAPLFDFFSRVWHYISGHQIDQDPVAWPAYLGLLFGLALLIDRFYDAPARDFLKRLLLGRQPVREKSHSVPA